VYLYHPHHFYPLYHHDLSKPLHHDLHHDLISIMGKGQNNTHEGGRPDHNYRTNLVLAKIHQPKSIHHSPVDNPSEYEHHHMSNETVPVVDQLMKVTVSVHPSFQNLIGVVPNLHDSHHHHYEAMKWIDVHEK
jgi:hypothetical protein